MPNIAVIDDNTAPLFAAMNVCTLAYGNPILGQIVNSNYQLTDWQTWCNSLAPEDLVLFLDLGLQTRGCEPFDLTKEIFNSNALPIHNDLSFNSAVDGVAAGILAILSQRIKKLLIAITSNMGLPVARAALQVLNGVAKQQCDLECYVEIVTIGSLNDDDAANVITHYTTMHITKFPNYHSDLPINNVLTKIAQEYNAAPNKCWSHAYIEANQNRLWNLFHDNNNCDVDWLKAHFMVNYDDDNIIHYRGENISYPIYSCLSMSLNLIGLNATLIDDCKESPWKLPKMPGIAFLIALKNLLSELEESGAPADSVVFCKNSGKRNRVPSAIYSCTISLSKIRSDPANNIVQINEGPLDLALRYHAKSMLSTPPDGGIASAIWSVERCRVDRMTNLDHNCYFKLISSGAERPTCLLSIYDHTIKYIW